MRKTIPVDALREQYDHACLARPENYVISRGHEAEAVTQLNQDLRGMSRMLENVLHSTGQYRGFNHIDRNGNLCNLDHPEFYEYRRRYY